MAPRSSVPRSPSLCYPRGAMSDTRDCPCSSGQLNARCCAPYHRGESEPPDAERLMRSRYSAYVKKDADYLYRTLHRDHADRERPEAQVMREIRDATRNLRFMALRILDREGFGAQGAGRRPVPQASTCPVVGSLYDPPAPYPPVNLSSQPTVEDDARAKVHNRSRRSISLGGRWHPGC